MERVTAARVRSASTSVLNTGGIVESLLDALYVPARSPDLPWEVPS